MATSGASDNEASSDSLPSVHTDECCNTSDEETWLFTSPRTPAAHTEWLRKDLDDPSLLTVRRSLLHKLDEIANTPKQTPQHTPNDTPRHTPYDTPKHTPNDTPRQTPDLSVSSSSPNTSGLVTPDSPPPYRGEIDSRTFVRPRKKKIMPVNDSFEEKEGQGYYDGVGHHYEASHHNTEENNRERYERSPNRYDNSSLRYDTHNSHNTALRNHQLQVQQQQRSSSNNSHGSVLALSSGSLGSEDDEHLSSASESSYCKIADVEDVNTIARLQEESLKLPDSRTRAHEENVKLATARSKISRLPAPRGRVSAGSSQEDLLGGPPYYRGGASSHASPRRGGDNNWAGFSPPVSPYTSNSSLNASSGGTNGIRLPSNYAGNYGSPTGSRGGSPARDMSAAGVGRRTSRLQPPQQVRGVVRNDRSRVGAGIPRPSNTSSPLHRPSPSPMRVPASGGGGGAVAPRTSAMRAPRVTPTAAAPAPAALLHKQQQQQQQDWREGCY